MAEMKTASKDREKSRRVLCRKESRFWWIGSVWEGEGGLVVTGWVVV